MERVRIEEMFARIEAAWDGVINAGRKRSSNFDHFWAAWQRFGEVLGGRLAAAISYYAFFAAFSLTVLAYSVIGRLLGSTTSGVLSNVNEYLNSNLPLVAETAQQVSRGRVTALATVSLIVAGVGWIESLRSSVRAVWLLDQHPGNWLLRRLVDVGMLVLLGLLLAMSLVIVGAINALLNFASPGSSLGAFGPLIEFVINLLLASAMLTAVARIRLSLRRLVTPALVTAAAIQLLNTLGRAVIERVEHRPAYVVVTSSVGLLIYLYVLNQIVLFGAALAATSEFGTAIDQGGGLTGLGAVGHVVPVDTAARLHARPTGADPWRQEDPPSRQR